MLATAADGGVQVHQFAAGEISADVAGEAFKIAIETDYPWTGSVRLTVLTAPAGPVDLALRIPTWCESAVVTTSIGGGATVRPDGRFIGASRTWEAGESLELTLAMPARVTEPDDRIDAVRGCVALERGPLAYCVETADLAPGTELEDVAIDDDAAASDEPRPDLAPGAVGLTAPGRAGDVPVEIRAVPYFAWANRAVEGMRVWIPRASSRARRGPGR
jgi:hypothetical protein